MQRIKDLMIVLAMGLGTIIWMDGNYKVMTAKMDPYQHCRIGLFKLYHRFFLVTKKFCNFHIIVKEML